jgi:hypothetical protein
MEKELKIGNLQFFLGVFLTAFWHVPIDIGTGPALVYSLIWALVVTGGILGAFKLFNHFYEKYANNGDNDFV